MYDIRNEPIALRINHEPPVLMGITYSEITLLLVLSIGIWIPLSLFLFAIGFWLFAPVLGLAGVVATVHMSAAFLRRAKRDKPEKYYQHVIRWWFIKRTGLFDSGLITRTGMWSVGRDLPSARRLRTPSQTSIGD